MEKYEIVKYLGRGSFGFVSQIQHKENKQIFAIKRIPNETSDVISPAKREAEFLLTQNHPCIVRCMEYFQHEEFLCIVMEYCSNGTLRDLIRQRNGEYFTAEQIFNLLAQLTWALDAIHSRLIIHRDIKPQNVLVDKYGRLKLSDFGLLKPLKADESNATPTRCGTEQYMSPEMFNLRPHGTSTDIWSLGCILYELIELRPAFDYKGNTVQLITMVNLGHYSHVRESIPHCLVQLVAAMINVNPKLRTNARDLLAHPILHEALVQVKRRMQCMDSTDGGRPQSIILTVAPYSDEFARQLCLTNAKISKTAMLVVIRDVQGQTMTFEALDSDTVASLKLKYCEKTGIPVNSMLFTYGGKTLEESLTLQHYELGPDPVILFLDRTYDGVSATMTVAIHDEKDSSRTYFTVKATDTVASLKMKYCDRTGIPVKTMRFIYCGQNLEDTLQLQHYDVAPDTVISFIDQSHGKTIGVAIRDEKDNSLTYFTVKATDTVASLKMKYCDRTGIPVKTMRFIFCGQILEDTLQLQHYDVGPDSVVYFIQQLRAAGENVK